MIIHVVQGSQEFLLEAKGSDVLENVVAKAVYTHNELVLVSKALETVENATLAEDVKQKFLDLKALISNRRLNPLPLEEATGYEEALLSLEEMYKGSEGEDVEAERVNFLESLKSEIGSLLLDVATCNLWCAGKPFDRQKTIRERLGTNEKTRVKVSLTESGKNQELKDDSGLLGKILKRKHDSQQISLTSPGVGLESNVNDSTGIYVLPSALELLRKDSDIKHALKDPLLREKLIAIDNDPSSFILQQQLDNDCDLRSFIEKCLETMGAVSVSFDDLGNKTQSFEGDRILAKHET